METALPPFWSDVIVTTVAYRRSRMEPFDTIPYPDVSGLIAELERQKATPERLNEVVSRLEALEAEAIFGAR